MDNRTGAGFGACCGAESLAERGVAPAAVLGAVAGAFGVALGIGAGAEPGYREVIGAAAVTLGGVAAGTAWWAAARVTAAVAALVRRGAPAEPVPRHA